tara:strand:+ start:716 stop:1099 length:384 start_codon:yes stop_codon:yes gene_type:complete
MDNNGRPNHIEDALINLHSGTWFSWTDSKNKVYANLVLTDKIWNTSYTGKIHEDGMIDNPHSKPTEKEVNDKLKELQDAWDAEHDSYKSKRRAEYPSIADQLDDIYHNGIDGWKATIKTTKDKYTKS